MSKRVKGESDPTTATFVRRIRRAPRSELYAVVMELARAAYDSEARESITVSRPSEALRVLAPEYPASLKQEKLAALYLDASNRLIAYHVVSVGSLNTTRTTPREIFRPAVQHAALGVILAHNHPSGCVEPSVEDCEFTEAVRRGADLLGLELYDHLILHRQTNGAPLAYTSLRERGML